MTEGGNATAVIVHGKRERKRLAFEVNTVWLPLLLLQAEREADTRGEQLTAIYHCHTYSQAYPSEIDTKNAVESGWTDPFYVLISLVEKTRPVVRAFKITDDGQVSEVPIKTDGEQYIGGHLSDDTKSN